MKNIAKKLQNLNYFLIMKYNRPLLYRLLKGFINEQERNGVRMYPRITIQDCNIGDLEIKDAILLDGMIISSNTLRSIRATNVKNIRTDD